MFICLGRRWQEFRSVEEVLEDAGGRAEVKSWRLTCVHFICLGRRWPEVGAVVEGLEDVGGRVEEGSWRLTVILYAQAGGGRRSEPWWRD